MGLLVARRRPLLRGAMLAGALVGLGAAGEEGLEPGAEAGAETMAGGTVFDQEEVWEVADTIPAGSSAALALLEHRWVIPLRDAIAGAGGLTVADEWIHPTDLVAAGAALSAQAQTGPAGRQAAP
jgi:hypothetical protein